MLLYCCWPVLAGLEDRIDLHFLLAGHMKNVCDRASCQAKRHFKSRECLAPSDMINLIEDSRQTTTCISTMSVTWRDWKQILRKKFLPAPLNISKFHQFTFCFDCPGVRWNETREFTNECLYFLYFEFMLCQELVDGKSESTRVASDKYGSKHAHWCFIFSFAISLARAKTI